MQYHGDSKKGRKLKKIEVFSMQWFKDWGLKVALLSSTVGSRDEFEKRSGFLQRIFIRIRTESYNDYATTTISKT